MRYKLVSVQWQRFGGAASDKFLWYAERQMVCEQSHIKVLKASL